jgi:DNA-binding CsgD family transcriptional regulator
LSRALTLYRAVQRTRTDSVLAILEEMSTASIACAANGKILAFNSLAKKILGDGLFISNDRLHAEEAADDLRLQQFISAGIAPYPRFDQAPAAVAIKRAGKRPLAVRMISLSQKLRSAFDGLAAILLVTDPHSVVASDAATLRAFFNLTAAEAGLAARLVDGASVREAAESLAIEESTARQYAKQVMAKSETHRQSEFVALAARLLHPVVRRGR